MSQRRIRTWLPLLVVGTMLAAGAAHATVPLITGFGGVRDYGTHCLSPNDDGSSALIDLTPAFPAGLRFFTSTHTSAYVNTNGNITFSGAEPVYTPEAFPVASRPMIAAYWADVDVRPMTNSDLDWLGDCRGYSMATGSPGDGPCQNPDHNGAWWYLEPGRMVITWDNVGYFDCHLDLVMDFQMIITAVEGCGGEAGDFDVEFRFNRCEWTTGDASGGSGGFGGTPAQVGFDAGNMTDYVQITGSMTGDIHDIVCNESNVGEPGRWVFQIRGGTVICPDAGAPCDTGLLGVCAQGRTNCVGAGTECLGELDPTDERCNALDDDCDGETDEGDGLCGDWEVCDRGVCRTVCSEFGCPEGQVCWTDDRCIDAGCEDVTCDPGMRCEAGTCVGACDGIICPVGTECRAGNCIDLCEGLTCSECTVCVEGACVMRCDWVDCEAGFTCLPDGRCVPDACASLTCDPGFTCQDGACTDECLGAVCPEGMVCELGRCVEGPPPAADADADGGADADADSSAEAGADASAEADADDIVDGRTDVPHPPGVEDDNLGCSCRAAGANGRGALLGLLGVALLGLARRRR
ncbi:MAG: hypothetical protein HY905_00280 [Deltaproteobacteria bacterium]|nr:hypothetical protein [Deltaproteobacteria bacterium]